jgi:cyanophycin synthetase
MAANILTAMPGEAGSGPDEHDPEVELLELRVLDGPNRFGSRPAVKLEFAGTEPGEAATIAASAALAVRRLHLALGMPEPRISTRHSADRRRTAIAYPWRRRTISQAIGSASARIALGRSTDRRELAGLKATALGPLAYLPRPRIPIIAITGTNGKSTTTRLITHIATAAGRSVGTTNSDGIFVRGECVEAGDWTGFGGASRILAEPGVDLAVLETARGGILLRGIGYSANDVSVVTNVSADHLGLQGIDTLDELAEVKSVIVRITKPGGWAVLNADDARVWEMRRASRAHLYAFSLEKRSAGVEEALDGGGRAAVVERGWVVLRAAGRRPRRLARVTELPVTVAGLSRYNVGNALAAAAACDAIGLDLDAIAEGLRTFAQDAASNPGRLNLYGKGGVLVLIDFAHNEAGMRGLLEVGRALAKGKGRVRLALGTAGDRTDEILHGLGRVAGGADDLIIAEKVHYLRGRAREEMNELLRAGAREGGYAGEIPAHPNEMAALHALLDRAKRGDVVVVMAHSERAELSDWLTGAGFKPIGIDRLRKHLGR